MPIPIKKTSFFIIPPTGSWRLFGQEENKKIHIHEKYSPHPQIILPFIKRVYRYLSTTLCTIHPLPPPPGKKTLYTSVFPYHPLLHRFLRFWIASRISCHRLDVPRSQCGCTLGRDRSRITHTRDSQPSFSSCSGSGNFFFWKILLFSSSLPLLPLLPPFHFLLLLIRFERSKRIILDSSFSAGVADQHFWEEEKGEGGDEENCIVYTNWYKKEVQIGCSW